MKIKDLAYALGISDSMASRLAKKGMPTHSIEAAQKWRAKNLDPSMTKANRVDGNQGGRKGWQQKRRIPVALADGTQAASADAAAPLVAYMQEWLPSRLFDPKSIAKVLSIVGVSVGGDKVLRLAGVLYLNYMCLIDPADELGCILPPGLGHEIGSPEYGEMVKAIDAFMAELSATTETQSRQSAPSEGFSGSHTGSQKENTE